MSVVYGYKKVQGDIQRTVVFLSVLKLVIVDHGKMMRESWKIMEKSWNLIPGKRWEPCKSPIFWPRFRVIATAIHQDRVKTYKCHVQFHVRPTQNVLLPEYMWMTSVILKSDWPHPRDNPPTLGWPTRTKYLICKGWSVPVQGYCL